MLSYPRVRITPFSRGHCLCFPLPVTSETTFAGAPNAAMIKPPLVWRNAADRIKLWVNSELPENPRRFKLWRCWGLNWRLLFQPWGIKNDLEERWLDQA